MTLFRRVTEICRERLPSIRVARITIDSIFDLDRMLQPGIRFGVTVKNTGELVGTPIASMGNFYFTVDVMDGDERFIIQKMENWRNGTYKAFYRIFYDGVCATRLDGVDGVELGWRNFYDVYQLNTQIEAAIEDHLTGHIISHTHPSSNYVLDSSSSHYGYYVMEKDAPMQASKSVPAENRFSHLTISFQTQTKWESWQFIGTDITTQWDNLAYWKQKDLPPDVYNLTENVPPADDFYTLSVMSTEAQYAPTHVPEGVRKAGLIITFRSYSEWETWQFTGTLANFSAAGNWKRIDAFIEQGVYDMDQQSPLLSGQYYQCSNDNDDHYIPSSIPEGSRVAFMKVRYINSYGKIVILRYALADLAYFYNYDYWDVLKISDLSSADIEKMLTGLITTHYHDTVQTDRVMPVEAINAPIARSFSLDPQSAGQGYLIITDAYTFSATITIELTLSYLLQARFYKYVLYIDMRHEGPLDLTITTNVGNIILKGDSTLNIALEKGIYKIEFIRQMSDVSNLVLYARHDFIPDDI